MLSKEITHIHIKFISIHKIFFFQNSSNIQKPCRQEKRMHDRKNILLTCFRALLGSIKLNSYHFRYGTWERQDFISCSYLKNIERLIQSLKSVSGLKNLIPAVKQHSMTNNFCTSEAPIKNIRYSTSTL